MAVAFLTTLWQAAARAASVAKTTEIQKSTLRSQAAMRALAKLPAERVRTVSFSLTDIDVTLTTDGCLGPGIKPEKLGMRSLLAPKSAK
jgi:hypothetical protein